MCRPPISPAELRDLVVKQREQMVEL